MLQKGLQSDGMVDQGPEEVEGRHPPNRTHTKTECVLINDLWVSYETYKAGDGATYDAEPVLQWMSTRIGSFCLSKAID